MPLNTGGTIAKTLFMTASATLLSAAPGEKSQNEYQISTLLSGMSGLIKRFVNNPVFGEVEALDVQAATAAKRDLERIIELSEQIRKKAQNDKQEAKQK